MCDVLQLRNFAFSYQYTSGIFRLGAMNMGKPSRTGGCLATSWPLSTNAGSTPQLEPSPMSADIAKGAPAGTVTLVENHRSRLKPNHFSLSCLLFVTNEKYILLL